MQRTYDPAAVARRAEAERARHPDLAGQHVHVTRTTRISGVFEAVAAQVAASLPIGRTVHTDVTLDVRMGRYTRTAEVKPSTPAQTAARANNWLRFQIAGAVGHLSTALSRGARLPDPRDDADLREALALLGGIERRRRERNESNMETTK